MPIVFRPASADDLAPAEELVAGSINDLTLRHGFGVDRHVAASGFPGYCLRDDPRGVWLAEDDGEIVGFALSWGLRSALVPGRTVRCTRPAGTGHRQRTAGPHHAACEPGRCDRKEPDYLRLQRRVPGAVCAARPFAARALSICAAPSVRHWCSMRRARRFARRLSKRRLPILKCCGRSMSPSCVFSREKHHRYLLADPRMQGVFLEDGGERVGYAYIAATGHVGPLAVMHTHAMPGAFRAALALAVAGEAKQISVFVPDERCAGDRGRPGHAIRTPNGADGNAGLR
ncbi:GNAT family N-acetyltransferase [Cupriavidus basilensis]